jgi:Flp pilus assembly protein TadG
MGDEHFCLLAHRSIKKTKSNGSILFEFALVMPIFLILILGGVDLVLATAARSNLSYVAIQTAACGAQTPTNCPILEDYAEKIARDIGMNAPVTLDKLSACAGCVKVVVRMTTIPVGPFFPAINFASTATATITATITATTKGN